eukprot:2896897-Prymnesium_polylepis.2
MATAAAAWRRLRGGGAARRGGAAWQCRAWRKRLSGAAQRRSLAQRLGTTSQRGAPGRGRAGVLAMVGVSTAA